MFLLRTWQRLVLEPVLMHVNKWKDLKSLLIKSEDDKQLTTET